MSEPLLQGVVTIKQKLHIKLNGGFQAKARLVPAQKRMFDQRLESITVEDIDAAKHLINNDALVFYKGKKLAVPDYAGCCVGCKVDTYRSPHRFLPFASIYDRIQNFKGWTIYR